MNIGTGRLKGGSVISFRVAVTSGPHQDSLTREIRSSPELARLSRRSASTVRRIQLNGSNLPIFSPTISGGLVNVIAGQVARASTVMLYSSGCIEARKPYLPSNRTEEAISHFSLVTTGGAFTAGHATYTEIG